MYHDKTLKAAARSKKGTSAWGMKPLGSTAPRQVTPAEAARLNVSSRGIPEEAFVEAALSILMGSSNNEIGRLARQVRTAGKTRAQTLGEAHNFRTDLSDLPLAHAQYAYVLPPNDYAGPVSPEGYSARLLSRRANQRILSVIERELSVSHEKHGEDLRELRSYFPDIYENLITGFPRSALEAAVEADANVISVVRPVVATHVLLLSVATAHLRIAVLANSARHPLGGGWSGQSQWPTMASVSSAALVGPAKALHGLLGLPVSEDMTDAQALELAREEGFLGDDSSSQLLISIANKVRDRLPEHDLARSFVEHTTREVLRSSAPLKSLSAEDVSAAGFTRRSFTEERFGVKASEGAVIVAMNLAVQCGRIEACIDAVLARSELPTFDPNPTTSELSNNSVARLSEALRIEGKTDRFAPNEPGDPVNRNGKQLVMSTRKKIAGGAINDALAKLQINPAEFFRRKMKSP